MKNVNDDIVIRILYIILAMKSMTSASVCVVEFIGYLINYCASPIRAADYLRVVIFFALFFIRLIVFYRFLMGVNVGIGENHQGFTKTNTSTADEYSRKAFFLCVYDFCRNYIPSFLENCFQNYWWIQWFIELVVVVVVVWKLFRRHSLFRFNRLIIDEWNIWLCVSTF